jgi:hypothetical protein
MVQKMQLKNFLNKVSNFFKKDVEYISINKFDANRNFHRIIKFQQSVRSEGLVK